MRLIHMFLKNALMKEIEYRKSFYIGILAALIEASMLLVSTLFLYSITENIGGWNRYQYFVLIGVLQIIQAVSYGILYPNLGQLSHYINQGDLDYILLKPRSSLFLVSVKNYSIIDLPQGVIGIVFILYGISALGTPVSLGTLLMFLYLLFTALIITYSLFLIMMVFSFWTEKLSNMGDLWTNIMALARFPSSIYKGAVKVFITYVLPISFMTTVPASVFVVTLTPKILISSSITAFVFLNIGLYLWKLGLKTYQGASS